MKLSEDGLKQFWAWMNEANMGRQGMLFKISCQVGQFEACEKMKETWIKEVKKQEA